MYSEEAIRRRMQKRVAGVILLLTEEQGGTPDEWLIRFQKSRTYANIWDKETHMWTESDGYIMECFLEERERQKAQET